MRHEVARTVVCYGYIVNKPAVPSAASIGTGVAGNGRVGSCRDNVPLPSRCADDREGIFVAASVKAVGGLDGRTRPTQVNCRKHRQTLTSQRRCQAPTKRCAVRLLVFSMPAHGLLDCRCSRQGLNPPSLFARNMVNPASRLVEADASARSVAGMTGRGTLEKAKAAR